MFINKKYQQQSQVQNYSQKQTIEGVELIVNNWFNTVDGNFAEILRYDDGKIAGVAGW